MESSGPLSLQAKAAEAIRQGIQTGRLSPGMKLSEAQLAKELGVSRTPVREALQQLKAEGLVEIRRRVGTFVVENDIGEIRKLFHVKALLEGAAAGLVARESNPELLDALKACVEGTRASFAQDVEVYVHEIATFHELIIAACGNRHIQEFRSQVMRQLAYHSLINGMLVNPARQAAGQLEHDQILAAIEIGDEDGAEFAMREHVLAGPRAMMRAAAATK